jgi:D-amino-acid dehydrogenase
MKALIVGAGLIGLTSAYCLRQRGYAVTVIDRESGPGMQTSYANGALLTPSMAEPWNAPGSTRVLIASLGRSDAALQLRWRGRASLAGWAGSFFRNSRPDLFERNARRNLRMALYSLRTLHALREETGIQYGGIGRGTLKVFRTTQTLEDAFAALGKLLCEGMSVLKLSAEETVTLEPALLPFADQLAGALYHEADEVADAHRFCVALARWLQRHGVALRFGTLLTRIETRGERISAFHTASERLVADQYVVAAGSFSKPLLRSIGVNVPVCPVKGYSVTFDDAGTERALSMPVIDDHLHVGLVPLDGALRVVGTAEFSGFDRTLRQDRVQSLLRISQELLPRARLDPATAKSWCGLRPMSADGVPIVSATALPELFVNTGHGHLGWTLAAGSAQLLADIMSAQPPDIDATSYALARFV